MSILSRLHIHSELMTRAKILLIEDNTAELTALSRLLRLEGYDVLTARSIVEVQHLQPSQVDLVISDLCLEQSSGMDLLIEWQRKSPRTPFLITSAFGTVDYAVQALKLGAADFLPKPINPDQLLKTITSLLHQSHQMIEQPAKGLEKIIGRSEVMQALREQCRKLATAPCTVLLLGESGTGKELIAEAIHVLSPRAAGPKITINMAALPDTLIESELFGHVKGAFTNAYKNHIGKFAAAHQGTLFIDEIGDVPVSIQVKLLRLLESRRVIPLGGDSEQLYDTRIIAATSRDLSAMVKQGTFREDLYYRLNVVQIKLPALREHCTDIPELIYYFLQQFAQRNQSQVIRISAELEQFLMNYDWPGNIRQLRNCLESMCLLADHPVLTCADLPPDMRPLIQQSTPSDMDAIKKQAILKALILHQGNRTRAAQQLGISVRTLQRKLLEWNELSN
jgi:two-component system, NtrC family, response regulator HydG